MSNWLDDAAKGLAEDRLSRRTVLGRAAAALGGALLTGITPGSAFGAIFPSLYVSALSERHIMLQRPSRSWLLSESQVLRRPLLPPEPTLRQPRARRVLQQARQGMQQPGANEVLPPGNHVLHGSIDPRRPGALL